MRYKTFLKKDHPLFFCWKIEYIPIFYTFSPSDVDFHSTIESFRLSTFESNLSGVEFSRSVNPSVCQSFIPVYMVISYFISIYFLSMSCRGGWTCCYLFWNWCWNRYSQYNEYLCPGWGLKFQLTGIMDIFLWRL